MERSLLGPGVHRRDRRPPAFEIDEQRGEIGRVDPADPAGLAERVGAYPLEFLAGLGAKLGDVGIIEAGGERLVLRAAKPLALLRLAVDVAAVLGLDRHL